MNEGFHVGQVALEGAAPFGRQSVFSPRHPAFEGLGARDIARLLQPARVHREVPVGRARQSLARALVSGGSSCGALLCGGGLRHGHPPYRRAIRTPNTICKPPNPAARKAVPQETGEKRQIAPRSMKARPITGTIRTAKAPP